MSTLVSPPRSLPRRLIVPRIVGAGEYSARLVSPRSRDAPVAIEQAFCDNAIDAAAGLS
jgi:hypothetical protein